MLMTEDILNTLFSASRSVGHSNPSQDLWAGSCNMVARGVISYVGKELPEWRADQIRILLKGPSHYPEYIALRNKRARLRRSRSV